MLNSFANIFSANEVIRSEFLKPLICNCLLMSTCQGYARSSHQTNLPGIYPSVGEHAVGSSPLLTWGAGELMYQCPGMGWGCSTSLADSSSVPQRGMLSPQGGKFIVPHTLLSNSGQVLTPYCLLLLLTPARTRSYSRTSPFWRESQGCPPLLPCTLISHLRDHIK